MPHLSTTQSCWLGTAAVLACALALSLWCLTFFPETVPTHWNLRGEIDGYGSRFIALFTMPAVMIVMVGFFAVLPVISPRGFEVDARGAQTMAILVVVMVFLGYLHVTILRATWLGVEGRSGFDLGRWLFMGLYGFMALIGWLLRKVPRNFYMGVRVPWTIANERVWIATHRFASWVWAGMCVPGVVTILAGVSMLIPLIVFFVGALSPVVYSFVCYKTLQRQGFV